MKKAIIISSVFVLVLLTSLFIINASEKSVNSIQNGQEETENSCCSSELASEEVSDYSLFQLDSEWKTEENQTIQLDHFKGKTTVMAMIFANCTYACPIIVNDMKKLENSLTKNELNSTNFLLVSIDPERDTPEALKEFAERYNLDFKKWKLITGNESGVSELAATLGFKYRKEKDGSFSHSNIINIINPSGEVVRQHFGLNQDVTNIITELKKQI